MIVRSILFLPRLVLAVGCVAVIALSALPIWWFSRDSRLDEELP